MNRTVFQLLYGTFIIYCLGFAFFLFFPEHYLRDLLINFLPYILALHVPFFLIFCSLHVFSPAYKRTTKYFLFFLLFSISLQSLSLISPYEHSAKSYAAATEQTSLKIISANVFKYNTDYQATIDFVRREDPDVFGLLELTEGFLEPLKALEAEYPYHLELPAPDGFGIGLWSKHRLVDAKIDTFFGGLPFIEGSLEVGGKKVRMILVHAMPPMEPGMFEARNRSLVQLAELINQDESTVVMGDFNLTPWSMYFKQFLTDSGLKSGRDIRHGLQMSWKGWGFHLPIDHVFVSEDMTLSELQIGDDIGSDHKPLVGKLSF